MSDAVLIARLDRAIAVIVAAPSKRKVRQARTRADRVIGAVSLDAYVAWLNRDGGGLIGADRWRERGVTTARALGDILNGEVRRAKWKDRYNDFD